MKKLFLFLALTVGLLTSASTLQAQTVNMDSYITLTVTDGAAIKLDFSASTSGHRVRIVSGSNTQDITVNTGWYGTASYTADGTTMTVYGDISSFRCQQNGANLTALDPSHNTQLYDLNCSDNQLTTLDVSHNTELHELNCNDNQLTTLDVSHNTKLDELDCSYNNLSSLDLSHNTQLNKLNCSGNWLTTLDVSHNTQLERLYCYGNNFSTQALDDIYCSLPDWTGTTYGEISPLNDSSDPNHATVLATNKHNAILKSWKVQYYYGSADLPATTGTYTCPHLNIGRYITLTVKKDSAIKLDFKAATNLTPVRIVSGSNTQDITVGTSWYGTAPYTAHSTTMTIYGDLTGFVCSGNRGKITALDPSHNTQLKWLDCSYNQLSSLDVSHNTQLEKLDCDKNQLTSLDLSHNTQLKQLFCNGNGFSTDALDDIYCTLPLRQASDPAVIYPIYSASSSDHATVIATNAHNATDKNWMVKYYQDGTDISTTGSYVCPEPNMDSYITLTVTDGTSIKLDFKAAAAATPVRIVSGSTTQDITVGTSWTGTANYTADGTEMKVYGDLTGFNCYNNGANLTALDVSHNTQLWDLSCSNNKLSSLDLSYNTQLKDLYCSNNQLISLDVSNNTQLIGFGCSNNKLSSLDVSKNTQLMGLYCYGNDFTTSAIDDIYCALPDRTGKGNGVIKPVEDSSDTNHATVIATNAQNAIAKNWKVQYYSGSADLPATTGKHKCSATDIAEASAEPALTLYPNPVADVLYLSATARTIRIYNIYGIEVAHATDTDRVDVAHLPAGIYTVRADGMVAKMVKR